MQVIVNANEKIAKLWGRQKLKSTEYRLMQYTMSVETDNGRLIQNAMTGELVLLNATECQSVDCLPGDNVNGLQELIEKHFLVPVEYDEHRDMWQLRSILQAMEPVKKAITGYTILPTTHCNARCFYCYESNLEHISMTKETADDLVDFIDKCHGDKPVHLGWFGGEPLVGIKRIDQICKGLLQKGIEYSSFMITNGYIFDQEVVNRAKNEWKLKSLQITLDGTEEVYNKIKSYVVQDKSPYQRVMRNIGLLLDADINVSIRLNMDKHNHSNLEQLIDELSDRFGGRKGFSVNIAALFDDCGFDPVSHTREDHDLLDEWLNDLNHRLKEKHLAYVDYSLPMLRSRFCMADHDESVLVTPNGELHKCDHHIDDYCIGNIHSGITNADVVTRFKESAELDDCSGCPLHPNCYHIAMCKNENHCKQHRTEELEHIKNSMLDALKKSIAGKSVSNDIDDPVDYTEQQLLRS